MYVSLFEFKAESHDCQFEQECNSDSDCSCGSFMAMKCALGSPRKCVLWLAGLPGLKEERPKTLTVTLPTRQTPPPLILKSKRADFWEKIDGR